jgi:hypothetical protein
MPTKTIKKKVTKDKRTAAIKKADNENPPDGGWKAACTALATCVVWALKFDKHIGRGTGMVVQFKDGKPTLDKLQPWQEKFFDSLDLVGVVYNREAYYNRKEHKRRA